MRHRPIVVEFIGRSGVGKTAIADRVQSLLEDQGVVCRRSPERTEARAFHGATLRAGLVTLQLVLRFRLLWARSGASVTMGLFRELVRLHWAQRASGDVVLLDQGLFVQLERAKRARFGRNQAPTGTYTGSIRRLQLPQLVVYVTATPERIAERRRLHRDSSSTVYEMWHREHNTIEADLAHLREDEAVRSFDYFIVENEHPSDVARSAARITARLHGRVHTSLR